jgi:hypothetical protein
MLGAQQGDEDQAPNEYPDLLEPPFNLFGLGQMAAPAPFQPQQQPEMDDQAAGNDWGQWLVGGVNATPAAKAQ